jgi:hypothetical protein
MNDIAADTYDYALPLSRHLRREAMENQRPAAWRVVFLKTLLEHLVKNGGTVCR